jgi:hypothetical protein
VPIVPRPAIAVLSVAPVFRIWASPPEIASEVMADSRLRNIREDDRLYTGAPSMPQIRSQFAILHHSHAIPADFSVG